MTFHVISNEVVVFDKKTEIGVLPGKLKSPRDDAISPREAFFPSARPKEIKMRKRHQKHLPWCCGIGGLLRREGTGKNKHGPYPDDWL